MTVFLDNFLNKTLLLNNENINRVLNILYLDARHLDARLSDDFPSTFSEIFKNCELKTLLNSEISL
mgnify:CR=1 FL=1